MRPVPSPGERCAAFDAVRVGAAGLVLLAHARVLLLRDAAGQGPLSGPAAAFFALSGLGHQAVIVFFVLSGTLVTGAMLRLDAEGRWSLGGFALGRLVRLWTVLVPCLAGGALLDLAGLSLTDPGRTYGLPVDHPPPALGPAVLLGNLLFLQTVAVPVLGSNGPLWSLANEAWYYAGAALVFSAWRGRRWPERAGPPLLAAVALGLAMPGPMLALAPVWAGGAAVALLRPKLAAARRPLITTVALAAFLAVLTLTRLRWGPVGAPADLGLGLATAVLLLALPASEGRPQGPATRLARGSYALYLSHLPVLALLAALTVGPERLPLGPAAAARPALALAVALAVAAALWWGFERHTDRVRAWLDTRIAALRSARAARVAP